MFGICRSLHAANVKLLSTLSSANPPTTPFTATFGYAGDISTASVVSCLNLHIQALLLLLRKPLLLTASFHFVCHSVYCLLSFINFRYPPQCRVVGMSGLRLGDMTVGMSWIRRTRVRHHVTDHPSTGYIDSYNNNLQDVIRTRTVRTAWRRHRPWLA